MIHPQTYLQWINDEIGYGVFAARPIPEGSIVYVQDELEIILDPPHPLRQNPAYTPLIEKYAFNDDAGNKILSWDHAKYVNHCCQANTLSTAYGFEIAVRDIATGEEITDEYALFTSGLSFPLRCGKRPCRLQLGPHDREQYGETWDRQIKKALHLIRAVPQPLSDYISPDILAAVMRFVETGEGYLSVR